MRTYLNPTIAVSHLDWFSSIIPHLGKVFHRFLPSFDIDQSE